MDNLEYSFNDCGVNRGNVFENIFTYSMFASQNLDFLASAAGKVDVEAARYIRTAQQMVRTRVDVLVRISFFGDEGFRAKGDFKPFGGIFIATSEDAGQAFKAKSDEVLEDLEKFFRGATQQGESMRMEGRLFENLRHILKAEEAFLFSDLAQIVKTATDEQEWIMKKMQEAAATICDYLYKAVELLRNKILYQLANTGDLVCLSCGSLFNMLDMDDHGKPAPCPVCGAPHSMIVQYEKRKSPAVESIFSRL